MTRETQWQKQFWFCFACHAYRHAAHGWLCMREFSRVHYSFDQHCLIKLIAIWDTKIFSPMHSSQFSLFYLIQQFWYIYEKKFYFPICWFILFYFLILNIFICFRLKEKALLISKKNERPNNIFYLGNMIPYNSFLVYLCT